MINKIPWNTPPGTIIDSYDASPPSVNFKCIVFSIIMVILYLGIPRNNNSILLLLFIGTILSVISYDIYCNCKKSITRPIIVAILMVLFIKYIPPGNKLILLCCLYFPYLFMAIYDHQFNCKRNKLGPTFLAFFYSWAKPLYSEQIQTYKNWHPYWKNIISKFDKTVFVILLILLPFYFNKNFKIPTQLR